VGEILLIAADWQMRALVRAQLLEEGYEVRAWTGLKPAMAHLLQGGPQPRVTILDLAGIDADVQTLSDLWVLTGQMPLLVCAGRADGDLLLRPGMPPARILLRPYRVEEVVEWVRAMMQGR
jgi:DNA-binding response OmpR family regulator